VREPTAARDREQRAAGVIDTLSAGYATINRHPWIIAVPVLLDLFLWLGPRLSPAPLVQRTLGRVQVPVGLSADLLEAYQGSREGLLRVGESFNLLSLLASHFPGIPSLMSTKEGVGVPIPVSEPWVALGLLLLIPAVGIWLASVYYATIGQQVRRESEGIGQLHGRIWRIWRRLLGFLLLLIGGGLLVGGPLTVLALVTGMASTAILGFMMAVVWVVALWLQFYLFFVVDAIVISDVGPIDAIRNSVAVVRSNLPSTAGLVVLIWLIMLGMPIVWDAIARSTPGTLVGILGNAYISTGLAVASMTYYKDRFATLQRRAEG